MDATPGGETAEGKASEPNPVPQEPVGEHLSPIPAAAIGEAANVDTTSRDTILEVTPASEELVSQDIVEERPSPAATSEVREASGI